MDNKYKFFATQDKEWLKIELIFYFDYNSDENGFESIGKKHHNGLIRNITNLLLKALELKSSELKLSDTEVGEDYLKLTYTTSDAGHVSIASPKVRESLYPNKDMVFCRLTDNHGNYEAVHNLTED